MSYRAHKLFCPAAQWWKIRKSGPVIFTFDLWFSKSTGFVQLSRYMFLQNFIKLRAALHELSRSQGKNSDEHNTVSRYGADSRNSQRKSMRTPDHSSVTWPWMALYEILWRNSDRRSNRVTFVENIKYSQSWIFNKYLSTTFTTTATVVYVTTVATMTTTGYYAEIE